jgi:hypothetical protein
MGRIQIWSGGYYRGRMRTLETFKALFERIMSVAVRRS